MYKVCTRFVQGLYKVEEMHFKGKKLEYRKYVFSLKKKINKLRNGIS